MMQEPFQPELRFCTNHKQYAKSIGGEYVVFNDGMNHRWICAACAEKQKQKREAS